MYLRNLYANNKLLRGHIQMHYTFLDRDTVLKIIYLPLEQYQMKILSCYK